MVVVEVEVGVEVVVGVVVGVVVVVVVVVEVGVVVLLTLKGASMRKLVEEIEDDGFSTLLGQQVTLLCLNYFYTGKLIGVNKDFVELESPKIVYETGEWSKKDYVDAQALPSKTLRVRTMAIESYGVLK